MNRGRGRRDQPVMAKLLGELLFYVIRVIVFDLVSAAVFRLFAWIDMQVPGRWPKIIVGGLLGIVAYFLIPIIMGILF
jgi:hypothetical protein